MIEVNISDTVSDVIGKFTEAEKDTLLREIAGTLVPEIRYRVHVKGEDADNNQIGTYSPSYMKVRARHNRSSDTNVMLSLTRQMENDMVAIKTGNGWGIGYTNELNYNKAIWNENRYGKPIWELSVNELNIMEEIANKYIEKLFNG